MHPSDIARLVKSHVAAIGLDPADYCTPNFSQTPQTTPKPQKDLTTAFVENFS